MAAMHAVLRLCVAGALLALLAPTQAAEPGRQLTVEQVARPHSEQRVALVIGNSNYKSNPLKNPVNDAGDMAAKLRSLGFDVIERKDLRMRDIGSTLRAFRARLVPGGVALVFYAGHGLQIKGENYLPAVDAIIRSEDDVPHQSLAVRQIMDLLEDARTRLNLVFLDACRNNPYARRFRSGGDGLARVHAPSGTLISYATRPGSVAADGEGANGLYTSELLRQVEAVNVPIETVLKRVVSGVKQASKGAQEPWMEGSIEGDFFFRRGLDPVARAFAFEDKDWGIAPTSTPKSAPYHSATPLFVPGARVMKTLELKALLESNSNVVVIDVLDTKDRKSLPGAFLMPGAGDGQFSAADKSRFAAALDRLTGGDRTRPLVFVCRGAECWLSYNAALHALEAGYKDVIWYRGGTNAWIGASLALKKPTRVTW